MSDVVIHAEGLGKKYLIGHQATNERYIALRDVVSRTARGLARSARDILRGRQLVVGDEIEEFWALKDVSFEIRRGDVVGIIGRNGAGKSTLLKILSRITEPSTGRVAIKGRVASLLEVGTGFHGELTGRENIYLNGAILGMARSEIKRKFDEIVAFAEVDRFLDTPVKRYSSGMYVRLAFAVAAHLEPEILIVDEVLAVGDVEFQKKCLGKMGEVAGHGRTVLFVSHSVGAIRALCGRGLVLTRGKVVFDGSTENAVDGYLGVVPETYEISFDAPADRPGITAIRIDEHALKKGDFLLELDFAGPTAVCPPIGGVILRTVQGVPVWGSNARFHPAEHETQQAIAGTIRCEALALPLAPGVYTVSVWLADWHFDLDAKTDILSIDLRSDKDSPLRVSAAATGYLEWIASWRSSKKFLQNKIEI